MKMDILGAEKKMVKRMAKELIKFKAAFYGKTRKHLTSLKNFFDHRSLLTIILQ